MFSVLLTFTDQNEAKSWNSRIDEYLHLFKTHSVSFEVTRLASIRLDLLGRVG